LSLAAIHCNKNCDICILNFKVAALFVDTYINEVQLLINHNVTEYLVFKLYKEHKHANELNIIQ